jgi:hypothetical protein
VPSLDIIANRRIRKRISENPRNPRNQRIKNLRWIFVRFWLLARTIILRALWRAVINKIPNSAFRIPNFNIILE